METPEFKQIQQAYWIRIQTQRNIYNKLMLKSIDLTGRVKAANAALNHAIIEYNNLKPNDESQK